MRWEGSAGMASWEMFQARVARRNADPGYDGRVARRNADPGYAARVARRAAQAQSESEPEPEPEAGPEPLRVQVGVMTANVHPGPDGIFGTEDDVVRITRIPPNTSKKRALEIAEERGIEVDPALTKKEILALLNG